MLFAHLKQYDEILGIVDLRSRDYRYQFLENSAFFALISKDLRAGNAAYVQELLFRAHIAGITTLLRNEKWIRGIELAVQHKNYFVFCACLRGLTESAADSYFSLQHVPGTLAKHFDVFKRALNGQFDVGAICCEE